MQVGNCHCAVIFFLAFITGGASGYLSHEIFVNLAIGMKQQLRYEGGTPDCVEGNFRNPFDQIISEWKVYRLCTFH